jgi:hypothetical protein
LRSADERLLPALKRAQEEFGVDMVAFHPCMPGFFSAVREVLCAQLGGIWEIIFSRPSVVTRSFLEASLSVDGPGGWFKDHYPVALSSAP